MRQMTMEDLFREASESDLGLEPVHVYIQRKPRPRRGKRLDQPCSRAICPHPDGDVFVLDSQGDQLLYVPVNISRSSTVHYAEKRDFFRAVQAAQDERRQRSQNNDIRQGRIDDLVTVDLMLREIGLSHSQSNDLVSYFLAHPDIKWEYRELARQGKSGDRFHFVRFQSWKVAEKIVSRSPFLEVEGLSLNAPDSMYPWLAPGVAMARRTYPTIAMALSLDSGKRMTLADCHEQSVDLPEDWTGKILVAEVSACNGNILFEVNADRRRSSINEWLCDYASVEKAVDLAALLEASADDILADMRGYHQVIA